VLVTKYRKRCINKAILAFLEKECIRISAKWDIEVKEFGGEPDHIHILLSGHPSVEMSKYVNNLKTVSSRMVRKEFSEHLRKFYWKPVFWTRAYCLITAGGAPLDVIKCYIENQAGVDSNSSPPKS
jgi:putative transposase